MRTKATKEISTRFITAMYEVIKRNQVHGGKVLSRKDFAESIGHSVQNFQKFFGKSGRDVTLDILVNACKKHRINPTWLTLGEGNMFLSENAELSVEQRLERIERLLINKNDNGVHKAVQAGRKRSY